MRSPCLPEPASAAEPTTTVRDYLRFGAKVTSHSRRRTTGAVTACPRRRGLAVAAHRIWEVSVVLAA